MDLSEVLLDYVVDISDLNLIVEHPNGTVAKIQKVGFSNSTITLFYMMCC